MAILRPWVLLAVTYAAAAVACSDNGNGGTPSGGAAAGGGGEAGGGEAGGGEAGGGEGAGEGGVGQGAEAGRGGSAGAAGGTGAVSGRGGNATGGGTSTGGSSAEAGHGGEGATSGGEGGEANGGGAGTTGGGAGTSSGGSGGVSGASAGGISGAGGTGGNSGAGGTAGASGSAGAGGSGNPRECEVPADCDSAHGASPCGVWQCTTEGTCVADSIGCTDQDGDGYGAGNDCACGAIDCNDADPDVLDVGREICDVQASAHGCFESVRTCADGDWSACTPIPGEMVPGGEACNGEDEDCDGQIDEELGQFSCGIGVCERVVRACKAGVLGVCIPGAPASADDDCNGEDDDCDGAIDEDCASCLHVAEDGDDAAAVGSNGALVFETVQAALDYAATSSSAPKRVCVAPGASCGATGTFAGPAGANLTMRDGVSLYGNYESTTWTRCSDSITTLAPNTALGVLFPVEVQSQTVLDGFAVERLAASTTAGVTIDGARFVLLSNLRITNAPAAAISYGVNLVNGADATVFRSTIDGGNGSSESIGVRAVGARVDVLDNCASPDGTTGRCDDACGPNVPSISGGPGSGTVPARPSYGISLSDAPGSRVERSAVCGDALDGTEANALRVEGDGAGIVVRGNLLSSSVRTAAAARTLSFVDCDGEKPWVVANHSILAIVPGGGASSVEAIRAAGDCHPVIDSNSEVVGVANMGADDPVRVITCESASGVPSRCVIANNPNVHAATDRTPGAGQPVGPASEGVVCLGGSCAKIARNVITARDTHPRMSLACVDVCNFDATGVRLEGSRAFVDRNDVTAGCAAHAVALVLNGSFSRIQNNRLTGRSDGKCRSGTMPRAVTASGVELLLDAGGEPDLHSNTVSGGTTGDTSNLCQLALSGGVRLGVTSTPPSGPNGLFRNNYVTPFSCGNAAAVDFRELVAAADPRLFQNNYLFTGGLSALYADDTGALSTITQVNALTDMTSSNNLQSGTTLGMGTTVGMPLWDFFGNPRPSPPRIGYFE